MTKAEQNKNWLEESLENIEWNQINYLHKFAEQIVIPESENSSFESKPSEFSFGRLNVKSEVDLCVL